MPPTSHADRHASGRTRADELWPPADAPRTGDDPTVPAAVAAWQTDHVLGAIWSRPGLTQRDRAIASLSAAAVLGHGPTTEKYAAAALHLGVSAEDLDGVVAQLFGYGGEVAAAVANEAIATAAAAAGVAWPAPVEPVPKDDAQRMVDAYDVMRTLGGGRVPPDPEAALGWFQANLGELGPYAFLWAFGDVWSHGALPRRDRSLVAIVATAATGTVAQLRIHASGGINHGLSRDEITEVLLAASSVIGLPRTFTAVQTVADHWATIDGASA